MSLPFPKEFRDIPLNLIQPTAAAPVSENLRDGIELLMNSIKKFGLLQPIIVYEIEQGKYELVAGRRRVLACAMLRTGFIKGVVLDRRPDNAEAAAMWLTENLVRHELNQIEVTRAFATLITKFGSAPAISEQTGIPLQTVRPHVVP